MTVDNAILLLELAIPDDSIREALTGILRQAVIVDGRVCIEFEELPEGHITVPIDPEIEIIRRGFIEMYHGQSFGAFQALVAIGGIVDDGVRPLKAKHCFSTLFFNAEGKCFTLDFHLELR
jgi:hypothetical protein